LILKLGRNVSFSAPRPIYACLLCLIFLLSLFSACGGGANKKPDPELIAEAKSLATQGSYWYNRGCYSRAERYFFQALETSRLLDDLPGMIRGKNNLGAAALALGRYDQAGEYLHQALELNQTLGSSSEQSMILGNLAGLAFKVGRLEDAERFWREAVHVAEKDESQTGLALHLGNLGMLMRTTNRLEEAAGLLERARSAALKAGPGGISAGIHLQLGLLAQVQGRLTEAEGYIKTALQMDKEAENALGVAQDLEKLGLLFHQREMWTEAAATLDRAFYLYAALGDQAKVLMLYQWLQKNHAAGGRPESLAPYAEMIDQEEKISESILCR